MATSMPVEMAPFADWSSRTSSCVSMTSSVSANALTPSRSTRCAASG